MQSCPQKKRSFREYAYASFQQPGRKLGRVAHREAQEGRGENGVPRCEERHPCAAAETLVPRVIFKRCIALRYSCPAAAINHISQYDIREERHVCEPTYCETAPRAIAQGRGWDGRELVCIGYTPWFFNRRRRSVSSIVKFAACGCIRNFAPLRGVQPREIAVVRSFEALAQVVIAGCARDVQPLIAA